MKIMKIFVVLFLILANGTILAAQIDTEPIDISNLDRLGEIGSFSSKSSWGQLAWSPLENTLAVATSDGIDLYDFENEQLQLRQTFPTDQTIYGLAFSPDGQLVAGGDASGLIHMWHVETHEKLLSWSGHESFIWQVTFSTDNKVLASQDTDRIRVWNVEDGSLLLEIDNVTVGVDGMRFRNDQTLMAGDFDGVLHSWNIYSGEEIATLPFDSPIIAVDFAINPEILAVSAGVIHIGHMQSGKRLQMRGHVWPIWTIGLSPGGNLLASGSADETLRLWDTKTGDELRVLRGHFDEVTSVSFNHDSSLLASGSENGIVRIWDVASGNELTALKMGWLNDVEFSPDDRLLFTSHTDATVHVWDIETTSRVQTIETYPGSVESIALDTTGNRLATVSGGISPEESGYVVQLWDTATWAELASVQLEDQMVYGFEFVLQDQALALTADNKVILYDGKTLEQLQSFSADDTLRSIAYNVPMGLIAGGDRDGEISVWEIATGDKLYELNTHRSSITDLAFDNAGQMLVSADDAYRGREFYPEETAISLQSFSKKTILAEVPGWKQFSLTPDGLLLVFISHNNTIGFWDVVNDREVRHLNHITENMVFNHNGNLLITYSADGAIHLWGIL